MYLHDRSAVLLLGGKGSGKTAVARRFAAALECVVYMNTELGIYTYIYVYREILIQTHTYI